jgi:hypothetical protein
VAVTVDCQPASRPDRRNSSSGPLTCSGCVKFDACGAPSTRTTPMHPGSARQSSSPLSISIDASAVPWNTIAGQAISPSRPSHVCCMWRYAGRRSESSVPDWVSIRISARTRPRASKAARSDRKPPCDIPPSTARLTKSALVPGDDTKLGRERVNLRHIHPPGPCLRTERRWAVTVSNRRPPACKAGALPAELTAPARMV